MKSTLPSPSPDNLVQVIDHRDPQLRITTTSKDWSADFGLNVQKPIAVTLFTLTIPEWAATTDGVERSEKCGPGEFKSKTHWEGDRLITAWSLERDGRPEITGEWIRSLSADGRTQSLEIKAHDPQRGARGEAKLVFEKSEQGAAGIGGGVRGGVGDGVRGGVVRAVSQGVKGDPPDGGPSISGTVFDPSGARVPNTVVNVMKDSGVVKRTTVTNDEGGFALAVVPPGRYQLEVIGAGFAVYHERINLPDGVASPQLNVVLQPGPITESVEVVAKAAPRSRTTPQNAVPRRIRVGGQVEAAKLIEQKKPEYPESARLRGIEGVVLLEAVISMEGIPLNWKVLSSPDPDLSEAAINAVREWRYQPTLLNGEPIEIVTTITVRFRLEDAAAPGAGT